MIWLRVAAAILLVAVATFLFWTNQSTSPTQQLADEINKKTLPEVHKEPETKSDEEKNSIQPGQVQPSVATNSDQRTKAIKTIQPSIEKSADKEPSLLTEPVVEELASSTPPVDQDVDSSAFATLTIEEVVIAETTTEQSQEQVPARVLVFSVEEVDSKYLDKEALAKATSSQKKASTFRKLLNKAYDLKNNQDPFGDLRQKKNEILALNFKSEKRSQNK